MALGEGRLHQRFPQPHPVAGQLEADAALTNKPYSRRYFQEVVLDPPIIDEGLQVAVDLLV